MRSIWKGRMGFGLVGFEAKLYKATDDADTPLHLMHAECGGGRISYQCKCIRCQAIVPRGELQRGYEYAKDVMVVLTEEDMARLPLKSLREIEVVGFTADTIDPRAVDTSFYLAPEKGGANIKPFTLLLQAMERLGVNAIGRLVYHEREHVCICRPYKGIMLLQTLCYVDQIRDCTELVPEAVALAEQERALGEMLVKQMVQVFDPAAFKDEYREALEALIEAKIAGREVAAIAGDTQ